MTATDKDPRFVAAVDLLGRSGARQVSIRYCDEEEPLVWIAAAMWETGARTVHGDISGNVWQAAGSTEPWKAMMNLLETVLDGGECQHCHKPTSVDDGPEDKLLHELNPLVCFYRFDPELATFRRMCEGKAA